MIIFTPNTIIKSGDINLNFAELKAKTDLVDGTADADWQTPTLLNSWVYYGTPYPTAGYYKDSAGIVHLKGLVKSGTVGAGYAIFILPAGYRPAEQHIFATISGSALARCDVSNDGWVRTPIGNNVWFSISGISFKAEQ